ncbi:MAG: hypothetical protein QHH05_09480 [Syntrophomonadaceae bacterium]|nr:hypothetical protein [Syntrophomonadaceae bacterium]
MARDRTRPSVRAVFNNWRESDAPLGAKLRMVVRNNLIKLLTGSTCCGHHGEPGC